MPRTRTTSPFPEIPHRCEVSELDDDEGDVDADAQNSDSDDLGEDVAMIGALNETAQNQEYIFFS